MVPSQKKKKLQSWLSFADVYCWVLSCGLNFSGWVLSWESFTWACTFDVVLWAHKTNTICFFASNKINNIAMVAMGL